MSIADRLIERLRSETLTAWLGVATIAVVIGTFVLAIIYGPSILNSTSAVEEGTNLTGCRSSYNAVVVDRRTELDVLSSKLRRANTDTDNAQIRVTVDAIFHDGDGLPALLDDLEAAGEREIALAAQVSEAEQALIDANATYQAANDLSRDDPDRFLANCERSSQ